MSSTHHAMPILRTKLYRPPVTGDFVRRKALEDRLEQGCARPLTVVSAPAGYGKSSLVSHWLQKRAGTDSWLSLDESDSDLQIFLGYFVAALQTLSPDAGRTTLGIIQSDSLPPLPVLAAHLGNDLEELPEGMVLVLDDYQNISEPDIHLLLDCLLRHPSSKLHLVIISRRDPVLSLASLRARHLLTELRMQDLEFSSTETMSFFNRASQLSLEVDVLERVQSKTEGWPAGIRLASLALQQQGDTGQFLKNFGAHSPPLREYLVAEVLSGLSSSTRGQLLTTSILDRFAAPLCEAVWASGNACRPGTGAEFIATLEQRGLFHIPLDDQGDWFRFHNLFRDLLRARLEDSRDRAEIRQLHLRASRWFEANGLWEDAIRHALAGEDEQSAVAIVGRGRHQLMDSDQWYRLDRWLKLFAPQATRAHAQLLALHCWLDLAYWYRLEKLPGDLDQLDGLLDSPGIAQQDARDLQMETAVVRSALSYLTLQPEAAASQTAAALRESPAGREFMLSTAIKYKAGALQLLGQSATAEQLLLDHLEAETFSSPGCQACILQTLCYIYWCDAQTIKLSQTADRLQVISLAHAMPWSLSYARYFLGVAAYERNEMERAVALLEEIVEGPYRYPVQNVVHCAFVLSLAWQADGSAERAREIAENTARLTLELGNKEFFALTNAFQAELDLRQGRVNQALQWANKLEPPKLHALFRLFTSELAAVRVLLGSGENSQREQARQRLADLDELMLRSHHRRLRIDLLGMKALMCANEGDRDAALAALGGAVRIAQAGQLVRPLVDLGTALLPLLNALDLDPEGLHFVGQVIGALHKSEGSEKGASRKQPLEEPLSQRELEILHLLAERLNNREIAERLYISSGTVKRHAHNIYGKLMVSGRREAVNKALALGLLKD